MITIFKILVLLNGLAVCLLSFFVFRISKYEKQKLIKLSSSMYKTTDFKAIVNKNITALTKIKKIRKEFIYSCIIISVAMVFLWLLSDKLSPAIPSSFFSLTILEIWFVYSVILLIEHLFKIINNNLESEVSSKNE